MAAQEDVALTLRVMVYCSTTGDAAYRVGIGRLEPDDTVGIHGGTKGGEVRKASMGEVWES